MTILDSDIVICRMPLAAPAPAFSSSAGALLDFWGVVRGREGEVLINGINYEAYEAMARHQLKLIAEEAGQQYAIQQVIIHHRVGFIAVAEPSLFLRVAAAHRGPAFEAGRWLIEQLKLRVPIWKHPLAGEDGRMEFENGPLVADVSPTLATAAKEAD